MRQPDDRPYASREMTARARDLRRQATVPEQVLWNAIRGGRLAGLKFRRQQAIGPYVADFYCHEIKLVVEIDGDSHIGRIIDDRRREEYLKVEAGLSILRVGNDDVLKDLESVLVAILRTAGLEDKALGARPSPQPSPGGRGGQNPPPSPPGRGPG